MPMRVCICPVNRQCADTGAPPTVSTPVAIGWAEANAVPRIDRRAVRSSQWDSVAPTAGRNAVADGTGPAQPDSMALNAPVQMAQATFVEIVMLRRRM